MSSITSAFATPAPTPSRTSDALYTSSRAFMCGRQCSVTSRTSAKSRVTMVLGEETEKAVWPPAGMTEEWAAAVMRLQKSVRGETLSSADDALAAADGDEVEALMILTDESNSSIRRQREMAVRKERESGNDKRVSALKEAQLRRIATGSARDYFGSFVETKGAYVDQGYVDESADVMGNFSKKLKGWFGGFGGKEGSI